MAKRNRTLLFTKPELLVGKICLVEWCRSYYGEVGHSFGHGSQYSICNQEFIAVATIKEATPELLTINPSQKYKHEFIAMMPPWRIIRSEGEARINIYNEKRHEPLVSSEKSVLSISKCTPDGFGRIEKVISSRKISDWIKEGLLAELHKLREEKKEAKVISKTTP